MYNISELTAKSLEDLQSIAKGMGIAKISLLSKDDLVYNILDHQAETAAISPQKVKKAKKKVEKEGETKVEQAEN